MVNIRTLANAAFRDYVMDGAPASGAFNPSKSDIRALFGAIESADFDVSPDKFAPTPSDGVADYSAAVLAAKTAAIAANLPLQLVYKYNVGSAVFDLTGVTLQPLAGGSITGNVAPSSSIVLNGDRDLPLHVVSSGITYDYTLSKQFKKPFADKCLWMGEQDLSPIAYKGVTSVTFVKNNWPAASDWIADTGSISGTTATLTATGGDGYFHGFTVPLYGGQELSASFSAGSYYRMLFVRSTVNGGTTFGFYIDGSTAGNLAIKNWGGGSGPIVTTGIVWPGFSTHLSWQGAGAAFTIRIIDPTHFSIMLNGVEIVPPQYTGGGEIIDAGMAVYAYGSSVTPTVNYINICTRRFETGKRPLSIYVAGDSKSDPATYGVWTDALREALDGSYGIRVTAINNQAVSGWNSLDTWNLMNSAGIGGANVVVIDVGTNDIQSGSPIASSISNLSNMLNYCASHGALAVVVVPDLWYARALVTGGGYGFTTSNYDQGASLRNAWIATAAAAGAVIVDLQQVLGPVLADYRNTPDVSDLRVRDNIHPTAFAYRLRGEVIARGIARAYVSKMTRVVEWNAVPAAWMMNSWTSNAYYSVDEQGRVRFIGVFNKAAGSTANGTAIVQMPPNLFPMAGNTFRSIAPVNGNTANLPALLLLNGSTGQIELWTWPATGGGNGVYADNLEYQAIS